MRLQAALGPSRDGKFVVHGTAPGSSVTRLLLQAIADAQSLVYLDALAHALLWEGANAARAPAFAFRHNDAAHLTRVIAKHGPGIVVVDSVYSTVCAPATSHQQQARHDAHHAQRGLMDSDLDHVEAVVRKIAPIVKLWGWPIARRARAAQAAF